ncbi:MAG TPA: nucleoside deaminase [bacterium]|nr:nucleoside deaminase [bacterium]HPJ72171.1 nucleoside deaminase [bacterium]HPQ65804.1 nucleoside deaminase [bacterium]
MNLLAAAGDDYFMGLALAEAARAAAAGEVPIGCVIAREGKVLARAHNQVELLKDATAHAEMIALTQAAAAREDWRLDGCCLFVTKEPCPMCAGAMIKARVSRLVFGAPAPRDGAAGSVVDLFSLPALGGAVEVLGGVRGEECGELLKEFFRGVREEKERPRPGPGS